jgi:hypothetical protein
MFQCAAFSSQNDGIILVRQSGKRRRQLLTKKSLGGTEASLLHTAKIDKLLPNKKIVTK